MKRNMKHTLEREGWEKMNKWLIHVIDSFDCWIKDEVTIQLKDFHLHHNRVSQSTTINNSDYSQQNVNSIDQNYQNEGWE